MKFYICNGVTLNRSGRLLAPRAAPLLFLLLLREPLGVKKLAALKRAIGGEENCEGKQDSLAPSAIRLLQVNHLPGFDPESLLLLLVLVVGLWDAWIPGLVKPHGGRRAQVRAPGRVEDGAADHRVGEGGRPRDDGRHDVWIP